MKIACIGDVHGTPKFLECYERIKEVDNDVDKIIVFGDHFDPYDDIPFEVMLDRYRKFIECCKSDDRIISLLGNHDLDGYVIYTDNNRTARDKKIHDIISDEIGENLPDSYLVYRIGNWLFSHAGVSQFWLNRVSMMNKDYPDMLMSNKKGWTFKELDDLCEFYPGDYSNCGNDVRQGCTWIRPNALVKGMVDGYNQVVAHTRVKEICSLKDACDDGSVNNDIWLVDNCGKSEYLIINVEESE